MVPAPRTRDTERKLFERNPNPRPETAETGSSRKFFYKSDIKHQSEHRKGHDTHESQTLTLKRFPAEMRLELVHEAAIPHELKSYPKPQQSTQTVQNNGT